mmetsp:Transcript_35019/g.91977  ORF Transcript_35019/g.91977 Transcript_35019/m.91977 type:complete len:164 (+) Transcript_35019:70-561(+)
MAQAFSQCPMSPSSPRDLMQVRNAQIQEDNCCKERAQAEAWNTEYRAKRDRRTMESLLYQPRAVEKPLIMPLPSSQVAARLQGGWYTPKPVAKISGKQLYKKTQNTSREAHPVFNQSYVRGDAVLPGFYHLPLMYHPRQRMPSHYGRSLHTQPGMYGQDPRGS